MGIPILTSEGVVGQRWSWIIDDYFQAGETLYCGDVVVIRQQSNSARLYRPLASHEQRAIGIVHTPAARGSKRWETRWRPRGTSSLW